MARIQVPKKGTFTCDSSTAEEALEYLRQVSLGCHRRIQCAVDTIGLSLVFALGFLLTVISYIFIICSYLSMK